MIRQMYPFGQELTARILSKISKPEKLFFAGIMWSYRH